MNTGQAELYSKCEKKLEMISSKRDCDLPILVGHSAMLQSLMYTLPAKGKALGSLSQIVELLHMSMEELVAEYPLFLRLVDLVKGNVS
jgi:hypothetical protein